MKRQTRFKRLKNILGSVGIVLARMCDDTHEHRTGLAIWVIWDTRTGKVDHFDDWDTFYTRCLVLYVTIDN